MTKLGQKRKANPLKKKADAKFSLYIRNRADFTCEYCGKKDVQLHCHHGVVHRRYMNTRYEPGNAVCVCVSCHNFLSDFPGVNTEFFKKRIGTERYEQLENLARSGAKVDLNEVLKEME